MHNPRDYKTTAVSDSSSRGIIRARTYVLGVLFVILVCLIVAYSELVASRGGSVDAVLLGAMHMPPGAIAGLIVILFGNAVLRRLAPGLRLSPAELIVIYFMMVCAALLSSFGLTAQLLPNMMALNYFATPENQWREMFYQHIPNWLVPWDPSGEETQAVTRGFYEGLRYGDPIPWSAWITPLIAWTLLAFCLFFLMACVATLFRKQWVNNERLSFPLVQLPVEMVDEERKPFLRNNLMWIGFAIPAVLHLINGLNNNLPQVPNIPIIFVLNQYVVGQPWESLHYTPVILTLSVVGFSYLLPLDVAFSFWFFLLFFRFQDIIWGTLGYGMEDIPLYPARYHIGYQSAGAFFVIVLFMVLLARPHFKTILRRVFTKEESDVDADEFMGYRTAFWGMIVSFSLIVGWCWLAGINVFVAALMMFIFVFVIMLVLSRCVAEVGLLMLQPIFRPMDIWAIGAAPAALGPANLILLALINGSFYRDPRTLMPVYLDSMKAADLVGAKKKKVAIGILIAVVVGVAAAFFIQLTVIYQMGGISLNRWFFLDNPQAYIHEAAAITKADKGFDIRAPIWFSVGAVVTFFLYYMRTQFWWWPFHPLGYAMGAAWPAIVYWFAFFLGWMAKALILRYGGVRLYGIARPFFLGLIFGEISSAIFWATLVGLFGVRAPSIPIT